MSAFENTSPPGGGERVTHLEPILARADYLELRRDSLDLAGPLLDLRGEDGLPVALQSRIIAREEPDHIQLAVQHEAAGVGSGEAHLLEPHHRRVLCVEIPHQHSIGILWIVEDELVLCVGQGFDWHSIAIGAHQLAGDAVERARQPQLKGWQRRCDFRQAHAFARAHVEGIAQPRQIEREEVQRAFALEQQRPLDQVRRARRQRFTAADKLVVPQQPRLGRVPKD